MFYQTHGPVCVGFSSFSVAQPKSLLNSTRKVRCVRFDDGGRRFVSRLCFNRFDVIRMTFIICLHFKFQNPSFLRADIACPKHADFLNGTKTVRFTRPAVRFEVFVFFFQQSTARVHYTRDRFSCF